MSDSSDPEYTLTVTANQAAVLRAALELYSRIGMAQFGAIVDHPDVWARIVSVPDFTVATVEEPMNDFKRCFTGLSSGAYRSIHSPEIDQSNRVAWDLQQVIRHRLSHDLADAEGMPARERFQTFYDKPRSTSGQQLATFTRNEEQPAASVTRGPR